MKNILIFGANSDIAKNFAKLYASQKSNIFLVSKNIEVLENQKTNLLNLGALNIDIYSLDFAKINNYDELMKKILKFSPHYDVCLFAQGYMPDQKLHQDNLIKITEQFNVNTLSIICIIEKLLENNIFLRNSIIGIISSVASDRGRALNYIYASTKSALDTFASGLRQRLSEKKINILLIKPGFVDTKMTKNFKKNFLFSKPEYVAQKIFYAFERKKNLVYIPFYWRYIMLVVKFIPEFIFKRFKF